MSITSRGKRSRAAAALRELGFSEAEAEAYVTILRTGPQSAYAAARLVGQAPSNMYRVIEGLIRKGALVADDGPSTVLRAVPVDDILANLRTAFEGRTKAIARELAGADASETDPGTYRLQSVEQVLTRCRNMLGAARSTALVDAFPAAMDAIGLDLVNVTRSGVRTLVKTYDDRRIDVTKLVRSPGADFATAKWPGHWLNVVVDGKEALIAYFDADFASVEQAIWTRSKYLAWAFHGALAAEMSLAAISTAASANPDVRAVRVLTDVRKALFGNDSTLRDVERGIF